MEMVMENIEKCRIAYVRQVGPYGPDNVQAMSTLKQWGKQTKLLTESAIFFGIPQDNPVTTAPELCRYDAAIVIHELHQVDADYIYTGELSGGAYLICKVQHTAEAIQQAWNIIVPHLHELGFVIDNKPVMERYRYQLLEQHLCEICVPVRQGRS